MTRKYRCLCCGENGPARKGTWSKEEDDLLISYMQNYSLVDWSDVPKRAGLLRCGRSCRRRWLEHLSPNVKHGKFTAEEEGLIIKLQSAIGNRWSKIATSLPGRTNLEIKNYWYNAVRKKLRHDRNRNIDPRTSRRINDLVAAKNDEEMCTELNLELTLRPPCGN